MEELGQISNLKFQAETKSESCALCLPDLVRIGAQLCAMGGNVFPPTWAVVPAGHVEAALCLGNDSFRLDVPGKRAYRLGRLAEQCDVHSERPHHPARPACASRPSSPPASPRLTSRPSRSPADRRLQAARCRRPLGGGRAVPGRPALSERHLCGRGARARRRHRALA